MVLVAEAYPRWGLTPRMDWASSKALSAPDARSRWLAGDLLPVGAGRIDRLDPGSSPSLAVGSLRRLQTITRTSALEGTRRRFNVRLST